MHRFTRLLFVGLLVAGCAGGPGSTAAPSPTAEASLTATRIPEPSPTAVACPSPPTMPLRVQTALDPSSCFGSAEVTILGWEDTPPPMGFEGPGIEPAWLAYPSDGNTSVLWQGRTADPDHLCAGDACPWNYWFFVHQPGSDIPFHAHGEWVLVTGHFNDPLGETCHYVHPPDWTASDYLDDASAREQCHGFVITAAQPASAP